MYGIIYKVTFPNNKIYIGQTIRTLEKRKSAHLTHLNNSAKKDKKRNYVFYRALQKYGFNNTVWEVIDHADSQEELNEKEIYWIRYYKSYVNFAESNGYNMTLGGESTNKFTILNDVELHNFGLDCKEGKSDKYLKEKYHIESAHTFRKIVNGEIWSYYTKIPSKEWSEDNTNDSFNRFQICRIIKVFKKYGNAELLAQEYDCNLNTMKNLLKGKTWRNFTGILSEDFYYKYTTTDKRKLTKKEVLELINLFNKGEKTTELSKKYGLTRIEVNNILIGKDYSDITHITKENKKKIKTSFLTKSQVLEIVKLSKKYTSKELANKFNVSIYVICNILNGLNYSNITGIKNPRKQLKNKKEPGGATHTLEEVLEVVRLHKENGLTASQISQQTNFSYDAVNNIIRGYTWSKYTGIIPQNKE